MSIDKLFSGFSFQKKRIAQKADLVDSQLKKVFVLLSKADFDDPSGFSELKKASVSVKNYLQTYDSISKDIKSDILKHGTKSQTDAFRTWMRVAEQLKQQHSYEGYVLVITSLFQLDVEQKYKFTKRMSKTERNRFDSQCNLVSPYKSFAALRKVIEDDKSPNKMTPLVIRARDLSAINEHLEQNGERRNLAVRPKLTDSFFNKQKMLIEIINEKENALDTVFGCN